MSNGPRINQMENVARITTENLLYDFLNIQAKWSQETFGPDSSGPLRPLKHLAKEVVEAQEAWEEDEKEKFNFEMADCFILLMDAMRRGKLRFMELLMYVRRKQVINMQREWPVPPPNNEPCEHVQENSSPRKGFTLIELLVSVSVICILMSLMLVAVHKVRESFRRTQARDEMSQFSAAAAMFKSRYGVHPPWFGSQIPPQQKFRLCTNYQDHRGEFLRDSNGEVWPEIAVLLQAFPTMNLKDNGLRLRGGVIPHDMPEMMNPTQMYFFWLTGGEYCNWQGLSLNPRSPFSPPQGSEQRAQFLTVSPRKFWDMEKQEYDGQWHDPWGTPYIVHPLKYGYGVQKGSLPLKNQVPNSYQIICAGPNKKFGPGGDWIPGEGAYSVNGDGGDDMGHWLRNPLSQRE